MADLKNNLKNEASPYLLQHADNPIHWQPWGDEAFQLAASMDRPVIISIGYSSCHWCHVMERETFENTAAAKVMNDNFICIKVDREERPDVDSHYMTAAQLLTGGGGWPLNIFTLPDGRAFFGGTYFRRGDWVRTLEVLSDYYRNRRNELKASAEAVEKGLAGMDFSPDTGYGISGVEALTAEELTAALASAEKGFDRIRGGLSGAPKFPMPVLFRSLLKIAHVLDNKEIEEYVYTTIDNMAFGGIYDQIGGGFSRYSTDSLWKVPHFEKMLYDNAQLVSLYSEAYQKTQKNLYKNIVYETINFIRESLSGAGGLFYSALDADSEGEEGRFYVWTEQELRQILGGGFDYAADFFGIGDEGQWEDGSNILVTAEAFRNTGKEASEKIRQIRRILKTARDKRTAPAVDDKALTSWNALMISAFIDAWRAFGEQSFLDSAVKASEVILSASSARSGGLFHAYKSETPYIDAFFEDYSFFISSLISIFEASGDINFLKAAEKLTTEAMDKFFDKELSLFYETPGKDNRIRRTINTAETTVPSSNSVMAENLSRISRLTDNPLYSEISDGMIAAMKPRLLKDPVYHPNWLFQSARELYPLFEIKVTGTEAPKISTELQAEFIPGAVHSFSEDSGETLIYVCRNGSCSLPVKSAAEALKLLKTEN